MSNIVLIQRPVRISTLLEFNPASVGTLGQDFDLRYNVTLNNLDVEEIGDNYTINTPNDPLVQANTSFQPVFNSSDSNFNGLPTMTADGVNEFMKTADYSTAQSQPNTIAYVFKANATGAFVFYYDGAGFNQRHFFIDADNPWQVGADDALSGQFADTDPHIMIARYNTTNSDWFVDGGTAQNTGNMGSNTLGAFTFAARNAGTNPANVTLARALIWTDLLTDAEVNLAGNGLSSLYNLPWTDI